VGGIIGSLHHPPDETQAPARPYSLVEEDAMSRPLAALLAVLAACCVSARVQRLSQDLRPPCAPEAVEVLEEPPDCPYRVIAHVESRSDAVFHGSEDLRRKLIEKAAELGGDALILGPEEKDSHPIILTTGMIMSEEKILEADVIVFDEPGEPNSPGAAGGR
jgi:hypothetical protein